MSLATRCLKKQQSDWLVSTNKEEPMAKAFTEPWLRNYIHKYTHALKQKQKFDKNYLPMMLQYPVNMLRAELTASNLVLSRSFIVNNLLLMKEYHLTLCSATTQKQQKVYRFTF